MEGPPPTFEPRRFRTVPPAAALAAAEAFRDRLAERRTVRHFAARPVPAGVVEAAVAAAANAPSGAHQQPWHFVIVRDPQLKRQIRIAAEAEFYARRAPDSYLSALQPLGTDARKPFLETAPGLVAIFAQQYHLDRAGERVNHYYVKESVGIATGFLIAALHLAGLATLTHTPSPMQFLVDVLGRPASEKAFLLLVVGYPEDGCRVPALRRKPLAEVATLR